MALKDFNYKQFFFDHGERIGLGVAGAITLLLVLTLFIPGSGLFLLGSAGANADVLTKASEGVENGLRSDQPTDADKPADPHDKLVAFNFNIIDPTAAKGYMVADLFDAGRAGQAGRQMPNLYQPTESQVALVRMQLPTLEFTNDLEYVLTLKNAPTTAPGGAMPGGSSMPNSAAVGRMFAGGPRGGLDPRAALMGKGARDFRARGILRDRNETQEKEEKDYESEWVKVSTLGDKSTAVKFAEKAYPLRVAEIVASFPYKDQVREFREKLRLPSDEAVLTETSLEEDKDGRKQNAFRFLGVTIQRRQLDAAGKPVGDKDGWAPLDLDGTYKPLVILDGKRFEEEDARLQPVIFPGLVMKKLVTLGSRRTPPLDEYPKIEEKLPALKATLDALEKQPDAVIARPALTNDPGNIFEDQGGGPPNGPNGMGPGLPPGPGGSIPPGGSTPPRLAPPGGSFPPGGSIPPGGSFRPPYGPGGLKPGQELAVPDACLIRLFDVTVEPGKTYEYRMQVRMANPNYHRTESASQTYADATELPTDSWYVLPQKLRVPNDLHYYAVDQKALDAKEPKPAAEPGKEKEPKLPSPPLQPNQTALQIHRWVDYLHPKNRIDLPVGDWVIAERAVVGRGEPIGPQRVEVPYWRTTQDRFTLATDVPPPKPGYPPRLPPSVDVPFVPEGEAPVVVDFRGGDVTYQRTHPKTDDSAAPADRPPAIQDKAPLEVLLLTPDGKLLAHDSANDVPDPVRVKRLQEVRDWIKDVKNSKAGGSDNTNPFGK